MSSQSVQARSLEMIVDQLFEEIRFLKKKNKVANERDQNNFLSYISKVSDIMGGSVGGDTTMTQSAIFQLE